MGETMVTIDGCSTSSGELSKISSKLLIAGDRKLLKVELTQGETTYVSWTKLMKETCKDNGLSTSAPEPPPNANPNLESRLAPGAPKENEIADQPHSNRFNAVIEKIERLYMGRDSSDGEELDGAPDDDEYDTKDSFIDDAELDAYFEVDDSRIKHDGFFVNRGKLERIEPSTTPNKQPKKRQRKETAKPSGDVVDLSRKQAKIAKAGGGKDQSVAFGPSLKNNSSNLNTVQDSNSSLESENHTDKANRQPRNTTSPKSKAAGSCDALHSKCSSKSAHEQSDSLAGKPRPNDSEKSTVVRQKENNGMHNLDVATKKGGSNVRPKSSTLEKAIRELEKVVAESRPPAATDKQDADTSSPAVKKRLPKDVKLKLAKVARIAGNVSEDLTNRLMSIVGHLIQIRSLKRTLRIMVDSADPANREKDIEFQRIKNEVIEMLKIQVPLMEFQATNQEAGTSDDFQDVGSVEKPHLEKKFVMDVVLEGKLCDLYDIFVADLEGRDEDSGPQIRKLYASLAKLWPNRLMNNHEIQHAICREKARRRALHGNLGKEMDQTKKAKKKHTQLPPKSEGSSNPDKASGVGKKASVVPSATIMSLVHSQAAADSSRERSKQQLEKLKGTLSSSNPSTEGKTVKKKTEPALEEAHLPAKKHLDVALRQQTNPQVKAKAQAHPDLNLPS